MCRGLRGTRGLWGACWPLSGRLRGRYCRSPGVFFILFYILLFLNYGFYFILLLLRLIPLYVLCTLYGDLLPKSPQLSRLHMIIPITP